AGEGKGVILEELAKLWYAAGYPSIAADYLRQRADLNPTYENYMVAGSELFAALPMDTTNQMRVNLVYGARYSFEKALTLRPNDIDARIGLATVLVQGTTQPMEGITLLREIDAEQPGNVKVNLSLGEFSMMSGQYEKAIERFAAVLEKDSLNLRSRYLMAEAYLGLKDTANAVNILEKTATLVQDTAMAESIRADIKSLKNH
ncbi:MAG: tetratricopeptide repeat protein, partial [Chitinophagales bacterium]|nr:tetratricopeptide repeat protein [Chitinophagales bacterium]